MLLITPAEGNPLWGMAYRHSSSADEGKAIVAYSTRTIFVFPYSSSGNVPPLTPARTIDLELWTCPGLAVDIPSDITFDWVTNIAYITYRRCGQIRAYDLNSSLFATIYEDRQADTNFIASAPTEGYEPELSSIFHKCRNQQHRPKV